MKRTFAIAIPLGLLPVLARAQTTDLAQQTEVLKEAINKEMLLTIGFVAVLLVLLIIFLVVATKLFRRAIGQRTDEYRTRHEQHMERVEQNLERIAKALEKS